MSAPPDCNRNADPLRLVREGTRQDERLAAPLDPGHFAVNERSLARGIVFARDYARLLRYFDATNTPSEDWLPFFGSDVAARIAVLAVEDVDAYKAAVQSWLQYLNHSENGNDAAGLKDRLGYLFSAVATLALRLDEFGAQLPDGEKMQATWLGLVRAQLAPLLARLIAYYKAGLALGMANDVAPGPPASILRQDMVTMGSMLATGLSKEWSGGAAWAGYAGGIAPDATVFGDPTADAFTQINHCTTHGLFRAVFDAFLRTLARLVADANAAIDGAAGGSADHEPHYALYLAFLRLFQHAQGALNTLTRRHLDFYYREILQLREKEAQAGHVHLLAETGKQVARHEFRAGELFRAGKDALGKDAYFAADAAVVVNQAVVAAQKTVYRHGAETVAGDAGQQGRLYASPVANSADGAGAEITTADQSWHPFFNKTRQDGVLSAIAMPTAQIGFAIASHHLLLAQGRRFIWVELIARGCSAPETVYLDGFVCRLTHAKGWLEIRPRYVYWEGSTRLQLLLNLDGAQPAITPYVAGVHGGSFATAAPVLQVLLEQEPARPYRYESFRDMVVDEVGLVVGADGLKSVAASNDFGPVDLSKPFLPFGPAPVAGSSLILGSKEIFQKSLLTLNLTLGWQVPPVPYSTTPDVQIDFLHDGAWTQSGNAAVALVPVAADGKLRLALDQQLDLPARDALDTGADEPYSTAARHGFARLRLTADFGQAAHRNALISYLATIAHGGTATQPAGPPTGPVAGELTVGYSAQSRWPLNTGDQATFDARPGRFFHVGPFGPAERHGHLASGADVHLLPQFSFVRDAAPQASEAELYIGVRGLQPPQNLALLFQAVDGTANPMAAKPDPHIHWSYLRDNEWVAFDLTAVQDTTGGLLNPGIVTLAVPRDATSDNTLLDAGLHWIRAAVSERSDAVCRLQKVAAQALAATFVDRGNAPDFGAGVLPAGTISKLAVPDAEVKGLQQPFASFGGRGREPAQAFYTRISERLRHKNRAITLWDYERLVLEGFPEIFRVKCLNHTEYEPTEDGVGIYRELAPGHVTVVTIPKLQAQNLRDPLKPYTNLGLLRRIDAWLAGRASGFVQLHVKNPQFEQLRASFKVRLRDGYDETHATLQLQQAVTRYLSPWAFADGASPSFGGKVHVSALIGFIEDQASVDYLTDFQLFQRIDGVDVPVMVAASGSLAVSVLVSAPAPRHEITVIHPADADQGGAACACTS